LRWKGQGKKNRSGHATHRCYVAHSPSQATVSNQFRSVPLPAKMHALKAEIRGDEDLVSRGDAQHGAVIANARDQTGPGVPSFPPAAALRGLTAYAGDQLSFRERHGNDDMRASIACQA
jgi:hypothetical protein